MSIVLEDMAALDAVIEDGSVPADPARTLAVRSILRLIDLLPAQDPRSELVDSTVRRVLSEVESKS